jgi:hypothetical protein
MGLTRIDTQGDFHERYFPLGRPKERDDGAGPSAEGDGVLVDIAYALHGAASALTRNQNRVSHATNMRSALFHKTLSALPTQGTVVRKAFHRLASLRGQNAIDPIP